MSTAVISRARLSTPHLRLTARGRAFFSVLGAVAISVAVAVVLLGGARATALNADAQNTAESSSFEYIQVEVGQSLWQVAQAVAPNADPRDVIYDIVTLNQLPSADVQPGQQLALPAKYTHTAITH